MDSLARPAGFRMNESVPIPGDPLPPHLEEIHSRFAAAWEIGLRPELEAYLEEVPAADRPVLVRALLAVEIPCRGRLGDRPNLAEYQQRYPEAAECLAELFANLAVARSDTSSPRPDEESVPSPVPDQAPPSAAPPLPEVPGYEVLKEVGRGGMGVVYQARQQSLGRIVALKLIRSGELAATQELTRFRKEAAAIARLDHPNVVRIYAFGEYDGLPYFAMEFVDGGSLRQRLARERLSALEAAQLVETLAWAMQYVHQRGIVHRDLKPANILLVSGGVVSGELSESTAHHSTTHQPKIADFGLVKQLDSETASTLSGAIMGTPQYMAPEQADGRSSAVSPLTDVYALGAILYELLAGRPPFRGETRMETINQVLRDEPVPPSRLRPEVPPELEAVCLKCLEKQPEERYASAAALAEDLRRFQIGEPLTIASVEEWERHSRWAPRIGYVIEEMMACSRTGFVYKARQVSLKRPVTLKILAARGEPGPQELARFRREAETIARLYHPNIVQIYDFGEVSGQPFLTLEYVAGGSLADKVGTPLPPREAAQLVRTLARATHFAHQQGIVHSNLRPLNVNLTAEGVPKITGFGLVRLLGQEPLMPERRGLWTMSSYMAPEQLEGRPQDIGPAADVHALGAILYELLGGRPPFFADTVQETLEQIRHGQPPPLSELQEGVPRPLEAICARCLAKEPAARYATAEELAEELRRFLRGEQPKTDEFDLVPGYDLLEEISRTVVGVVYRARQVRLDRLVALKIFRENQARLLAASRALARLTHPHLVQVFDWGERDGLLYVAEELVSGGTLASKLGGVPQPPIESARLAEVLARTLHYVHEHGIVHRNLKPSVVLLSDVGLPKISSFEQAHLRETEAAVENPGEIVGTPTYMAPEQVAGDPSQIGPATDVHGVGAVLYELLTGRPPFQGATVAETLERVRGQPPELPGRLRPELPAELEAICLRCLTKDPAGRFASAEALADALEQFLVAKGGVQRRGGMWGWVTRWLG
jgi:serine/threonine protein kinase